MRKKSLTIALQAAYLEPCRAVRKKLRRGAQLLAHISPDSSPNHALIPLSIYRKPS